MTYCVAMRLDAGLVFLSDSRTNAGVDAISTFRKMTVFEREGDRVMVLLTAGNLAISQAVRQVLTEARDKPRSLWTARDMFEAATIVGEAVREVYDRDAAALAKAKIDFNVSIIFRSVKIHVRNLFIILLSKDLPFNELSYTRRD